MYDEPVLPIDLVGVLALGPPRFPVSAGLLAAVPLFVVRVFLAARNACCLDVAPKRYRKIRVMIPGSRDLWCVAPEDDADKEARCLSVTQERPDGVLDIRLRAGKFTGRPAVEDRFTKPAVVTLQARKLAQRDVLRLDCMAQPKRIRHQRIKRHFERDRRARGGPSGQPKIGASYSTRHPAGGRCGGEEENARH